MITLKPALFDNLQGRDDPKQGLTLFEAED